MTNEHDHTLKKWVCGCDPWLEGIREAARITGNIEVATVDVEVPRCRSCLLAVDHDDIADRYIAWHRAGGLPVGPVICNWCWRRIPAALRVPMVTAYRVRRRDPSKYIEAQAAILQWCNDQAAARIAKLRGQVE